MTGRTGELDSFKAEISELQAKGFTSEILRKIKKIEGRFGPELLSQVETVEKCQEIEKEVSSLEKEKADLKREDSGS